MVPHPLSTLIPWKCVLYIAFGHHSLSLLKSTRYIMVSMAIVCSHLSRVFYKTVWPLSTFTPQECTPHSTLSGYCPFSLLESVLCTGPFVHYPFLLSRVPPHYPGLNSTYFSIAFSVCHVWTLSIDTEELGNGGKVRMRSWLQNNNKNEQNKQAPNLQVLEVSSRFEDIEDSNQCLQNLSNLYSSYFISQYRISQWF